MIEKILPRKRRDKSAWKGIAAGIVAGLVASWTMDRFQALLSRMTEDKNGSGGEGKTQESGEQEAPATVKAASAISEEVFGHELSKKEKEAAGPTVHYTFGAVTAGMYGAVAEFAPDVTIGAGLSFGTAVWLLADEVTVPLLGLSKSPAQVPLSKHAYALASHFVYGLTTEAVRRAVRNRL